MALRIKGTDSFKLNEEIAYKGNIGRNRERFCIDYIDKKRRIIKEIQANQVQDITQKGGEITCRKGCSHCCFLYMNASLQECEAIVYYLYHSEKAMTTFLKNYRIWREQLRNNGDIFKKCSKLYKQLLCDKIDSHNRLELFRIFDKEAKRYQYQNIPCPFLENNLCCIYEVRPFACVGTVATTPNNWCDPSNNKEPIVFMTEISAVFDKSFYYQKIEDYILTFFPITVYEILRYGYKTLAKITGLVDLQDKILCDPEVEAIIESYI